MPGRKKKNSPKGKTEKVQNHHSKHLSGTPSIASCFMASRSKDVTSPEFQLTMSGRSKRHSKKDEEPIVGEQEQNPNQGEDIKEDDENPEQHTHNCVQLCQDKIEVEEFKTLAHTEQMDKLVELY